MPIPEKKQGEKQSQFMIRCVPELMRYHKKDQAIAMCFKLILDCYVATLGEENAANLLETAVESIKSGNHSLIPTKIPKNQLN